MKQQELSLITCIYLLFIQSSSGYNTVLNTTAEFSDSRCSIPAGIDSMISISCSFPGMTITVTKEKYVEMLKENVLPIFRFSSEFVLLQDGAPVYISKMAMEWLRDRFPKKTFLAVFRINLAPTFTRSEPLTFLSSGIYEIRKIYPSKISQMKEQVQEVIESIPAEILQCVIRARGGLFEK